MIKEKPTYHKQVTFITKRGRVTTVDEDMVELLTLLKELGVETLYSCQGDYFGGYFLANFRSSIPFLFKFLRPRRLGLWAFMARDGLLRGTKEFTFRILKDEGQTLLYWKRFVFGDQDPQRYAIEVDWSTSFGLRLTMRWPRDDLDLMEKLLQELV